MGNAKTDGTIKNKHTKKPGPMGPASKYNSKY
jgi:hypothetical protein